MIYLDNNIKVETYRAFNNKRGDSYHSIVRLQPETYYNTGEFDEIFASLLIYCCVPKQLNHSAPFKGNGAMRGKVFSVKFKVRLYGK